MLHYANSPDTRKRTIVGRAADVELAVARRARGGERRAVGVGRRLLERRHEELERVEAAAARDAVPDAQAYRCRHRRQSSRQKQSNKTHYSYLVVTKTDEGISRFLGQLGA